MRLYFSHTPSLKSISGRFFITDPRPLTVLLSVLLSLWAVYTQDAINNDGIIYVSAAGRLLAGDWAGAYALYNWPFFPWLIGVVSQLFGVSLEAAAQLIDAAFAALLAVTFVTLIQTLGGDRKTQYIAAGVILLHPYLNEFRAEIFRDHGYWALHLLATLFFIRFYHQPSWTDALAWGVTMALASLFRIEGVLLLVLLPTVLWLRHDLSLQARLQLFLRAHVITALLLLGMLVWMVLDGNFQRTAGRLYEPIPMFTWSEIWSAFANALAYKAEQLQAAVLNRYSADYALPAVIALLLIIVADQLLKTFTPLYMLLALLPGLRQGFQPPKGLRIILVWMAILHLIIVLAFATHFFYLASRHIVPLMLILLVVIPFALATLYDRWQRRHSQPLQKPWLFYLVLVGLIYMAGDGLISVGGASKSYFREAGQWLGEHVPPQARLYSNDRKLVYYSGKPIDWKLRPTWPIIEPLIERRFWQQYDYLALAISRKSPQILARLNALVGPPIVSFQNNKKDKIVIYKVTN